MIELGVETLMVPANIPIGCLPVYVELYKTTDKDQYDPRNGCLKWLNQFSEYHNEQLEEELKRIRALHPHVHLIYADYFNAAMRIYNAPKEFGMYNLVEFKSISNFHLLFIQRKCESLEEVDLASSSFAGLIDPLQVCCVDGNGSYYFPTPCGKPWTSVCDEPSKYVSWDGLHLTEAAYKLMATSLLNGSFTTPQFSISCLQQNSSTKLLHLQ